MREMDRRGISYIIGGDFNATVNTIQPSHGMPTRAGISEKGKFTLSNLDDIVSSMDMPIE